MECTWDRESFSGLNGNHNIICLVAIYCKLSLNRTRFQLMDWKAQLSYYFSARTYRATDLATPRAFRANPSLVWEFYHHRREGMAAVEPNPVKRRLFLINSDPKKSLKMLPKSPYQEKTPKTVSNLCLEWNYLFRSSIVFTQDKKDLNFASFPLFHILYFVICTSNSLAWKVLFFSKTKWPTSWMGFPRLERYDAGVWDISLELTILQ